MQISLLKALIWIAMVVGAATAIVFLSNDNLGGQPGYTNCLEWFVGLELLIFIAFLWCIAYCVYTEKEAACTYRCIWVFITLQILIFIWLFICLVRHGWGW
jgi:hypothetical protein